MPIIISLLLSLMFGYCFIMISADAFVVPMRSKRANLRLFASTQPPKRVAIVGGGLAGLSVAHHLIVNGKGNVSVTIFDQAPVGTGGASAVAGGLLHPFSPRGKLVHWGMQGLQSTTDLIGYASRYEPNCVLRDCLYRIAKTSKQAEQLQETCLLHPDVCKWQSPDDIKQATNVRDSMGGILLECGKVIDVPLYLQGLWKSCVNLSNGTAEWVLLDNNAKEASSYEEAILDFDTVVLCAGAGLFQKNGTLLDESLASSLPIQLVRGQSLIMSSSSNHDSFPHNAILCGKYMAPMSEPNKVLVGATHEFAQEPWDQSKVQSDLQERCIAPFGFWQDAKVEQVTNGYRVRSNRGKFGRIPIVGKLKKDDDTWIFTGLSSRGLLHHGLYGEILANAILGLDSLDKEEYSHLRWWRDTVERE